MTSSVPFRDIRFGPVAVLRADRADGTVLLRSAHSLAPYPARLTERLLHWATQTPDHVFIARRGADGAWQTLTYAQTLTKVRRIAQALLDRNLSGERTIAILSENSLEHALLALAALHVGIPYSPISPPYSLISTDFGKLRHILNLMTPGLIFAQDGRAYARALQVAAAEHPDAEVVVNSNPLDSCVTCFSQLEATEPTGSVDGAFAKITPDTAAKVLFTSGSTSLPKGVINTHGMWCANLQQITQTFPFMADEPQLIVDWLPWNHTFGGNHNFGLMLYNGGALYIDDGRPTPKGIETTIANLRELAPTMYFNVPKGLEEVLMWLRREPELCKTFFSRLQMLFYAGASLPQAVWDGLEAMAAETIGKRVPIITGLGMTESGPSAMFANWPGSYAGLLGCPVPGLEIKLAPCGGKTEVRYRGPNVTPGYWRQPEVTAAAFDEEGFFRTGDAVKFVDANDPNKGLLFDGRLAEDFKLSTGTWVSVGMLRAAIVKAGAPIVQDAVITGHDRDFIGAILFVMLEACRALAGLPAAATPAEALAHAAVTNKVQDMLDMLAQASTGSANRIERALIADFAPSIDVGEITDKGSLNQRIILNHRAELVEEIYAEPKSARVFCVSDNQERTLKVSETFRV
jgi:feruloyl-CoA synthase